MGRAWLLVAWMPALVGCPESTVDAPDAAPTHCAAPTDCTGPTALCDPDRHECVACLADGDCAAAEVCVGGDCAPRTDCISSVECPGLVCDPSRFVCVECVGPIDCPVGETCLRGGCVPPPLPECLDDGDCTSPERCGAGLCVPECVVDADCGLGRRCRSNACEPIPPECADDGDCEADEHCEAGACLPDPCVVDGDCDDDLFCTGTEECSPGGAGTDARGCRAGTPPCVSCNEDADMCDCDVDGDDHDALVCSGDDCDDTDPAIRPGASEVCNGVDDDCSGAGEDIDGDGFAATGAACTGGPLPRTDCADTDPDRSPGATEICNGVDDDCGSGTDEAPAGADCASGEVCFGGACTIRTSGIVSIAVGAHFGCALAGDGLVYCWGNGGEGQLGDGASTMRLLAGTPVLGLTDAIAIAAGANHACAIRRGGSVVCWGWGSSGILGDGMTVNRATPVPVSAGGPAVALSAGALSTCALLESGQVQCWGDCRNGAVGDGTVAVGVIRAMPTNVVDMSDAASIASGFETNCAIRTDRSAWCWGESMQGQLGAGGTASSAVPVAAFGGSVIADEVAVGASSACARTGGSVACWGRPPGEPAMVGGRITIAGVSDAAELAMTAYNACVRRTGGTIACWGMNGFGEVGTGMTGASTAPSAPVVDITDAIEIDADGAGFSVCALLASRRVMCWGANNFGGLGDGTSMDRSTPVEVLGLP